ncbi:MAG: PhoPQ-activated protein PqaA family protein [Planctomycetia bacterium]
MSSNDAWQRTRRAFAVESVAAVVASCAGGRMAAGRAPAEIAAGLLAEYAHRPDPATRLEPLSDGELAGGRFRTCRLVSQEWRGIEWTHELSMYVPGGLAADTDTMLLLIDGGSAGKLPALNAGPSDAVKMLAIAANAAGLPAAVVRQVPFQPMFDGLKEDDLIAHTFVEFVRTGDPSWPLLLPMVKAAVESMTAACAAARDAWRLDIERFVLTGASKRGWTTWLTAAVDERVGGAMPMVIDMLSLERHVELQRKSFGGMSEQLVPYTSRGVEQLFSSPRGRELVEIVDPFAYRDRLLQPKVIALGTNDPYWPLESLGLYLDGLEGPRWVSYAPNAGHGLPVTRVCGLVAALGQHVAGERRLPTLDWSFAETPDAVACTVTSDDTPDEVLLWQATAESRDFRKARWTSTPLSPVDGSWRADVVRPASGFAAAMIECRYPREPLPLLLTSGVHVQSAG